MTHEELQQRIIEARLTKLDNLEAEFESWGCFDKEEEKKIKKIIKSIQEYEDYLYDISNN